MLERLTQVNDAIGRFAESLGFAAVVFIVALSFVDVLGTKLFLAPVPGVIDMVMMAQLVAACFAATMTLRRGRHIAVEFLVARLPARAAALADALVQALCLGLFAILVWQLVAYGYHMQTGNEVTPTLKVPVAPFAYAAAAALVPVCLAFAVGLVAAAARTVRR